MSHGKLRAVLKAISDLLFPPVCVFCGIEHVSADSEMCEKCARDVVWVDDPICQRCGIPTPGLNQGGQKLCGKCLQDLPPFDKARFSVFYSSVIRRGILHFKFYNSLFYAEALSRFLERTFRDHFSEEDLDAIIPIPVHDKRLLKRGYNQCEILSTKLGAKVGVPVMTNTLLKKRNTVPQTQLKRRQRVDNVKGSFSVNNTASIKGKRLLVLDDVFTTGSTLTEASLALKRHGASSVQALVLCLRHESVEKQDKPDTSVYSDIFYVGGKRE